MTRFSLLAVLLLAMSAVKADVDLRDIELPPGFEIEVYAEVPQARSLAKGKNGVVFVGTRHADSVYAVLPGSRGRNPVLKIDDGLSTPNGIAYKDGDLYVAEISRILVYRNIDERLQNPPEPEVVNVRLPSKGHHGWRYIGFGPDGRLYISIGAPCNVCETDGYAQIVRVNADGSGRETVATGIRNSVGFTWHPVTDELWFTDNGRDMLGDDLPADELNRVREPGLHFGFPYCHGGELVDPQFGEGKNCRDYEAPARKLGSHVAPLGVRFYTGRMFPDEYRGQIFIAEHGSWNRSKKAGYRITLVRLDGDNAVSYETFAEGWLRRQETRGRPVDLLVLDDGALLLSDDYDGKLYRISYQR